MLSEHEPRNKRVAVKAACEECRLRKTKCDGARPACTRCQTKRKVCAYSTEPEESRNEAVRRLWHAREEQIAKLTAIINLLRAGTDEQALVALQHIRGDYSYSSTLLPALPSDLHGIESLRELYDMALAAQLVTAPETNGAAVSRLSEVSPPGESVHVRAASGTSAESGSITATKAYRKPEFDRLTLNYIINDAAADNATPADDEQITALRKDIAIPVEEVQDPSRLHDRPRQHLVRATHHRPLLFDGPGMSNGNDTTRINNVRYGVQSHPRSSNFSHDDTTFSEWSRYHCDISKLLRHVQKPAPKRRL